MNDPHLQLILCCLPVVGTSLSAMYEDCCTRDDHTSLIAEGISDNHAATVRDYLNSVKTGSSVGRRGGR